MRRADHRAAATSHSCPLPWCRCHELGARWNGGDHFSEFEQRRFASRSDDSGVAGVRVASLSGAHQTGEMLLSLELHGPFWHLDAEEVRQFAGWLNYQAEMLERNAAETEAYLADDEEAG